MLPHERFDYSPLVSRKPMVLPRGARVAVYTVVNVEYWDIEKPVARQYFGPPQGVSVVPDVPNWSWHEYGMRIGIWRLMDALGQRKIKAAAAINARVCNSVYEPIARAIVDAAWPLIGHGVVQGALHLLPDQRGAIHESFEILHKFAGQEPKGWLGPGLHETWDTLDLLAEAGFKYVVDWVLDEQPFAMRTRHGPIVSMPYTVELSDLPMMVAHQHESDVWIKRLKDHFDRLYLEGEKHPRVMSMSVHPYIIGTPHRIRYFEEAYDYISSFDGVWMTTPDEIYDWFMTQRDQTASRSG